MNPNTDILKWLLCAVLLAAVYFLVSGPMPLPDSSNSIPGKAAPINLRWAANLDGDYQTGPAECTQHPETISRVGCKTIAIICDESKGILQSDFGGFCSAAACELKVPQGVCEDFGLSKGATQLTNLQVRLAPLRDAPAFDQVWDHCRLLHEVQHYSDGPLRPFCLFELRGSRAQLSCLEAYQRINCGKSEDSELCRSISRAACRVRGAVRLFECSCRLGIGASEACPQCENECADAFSSCLSTSVPDKAAMSECRNLGSQYCTSNHLP